MYHIERKQCESNKFLFKSSQQSRNYFKEIAKKKGYKIQIYEQGSKRNGEKPNEKKESLKISRCDIVLKIICGGVLKLRETKKRKK